MHMADALLSPAVGGMMWALSAGTVGYVAARQQKQPQADKKLPVMALAGAFVFAAQMINFTIPGTGSSGHIGGGVLLAGLLGPLPALLALTAVLVIQALFFADGGLIALGCNIFNMGVIPCLLAYPLLFRPLVKRGVTPRRVAAASVFTGIVALQAGAFAVVLETLASGITALPFAAFAALMQPIHLAIGLAEGLVTAGVLCFVLRVRPELLHSAGTRSSLRPGLTLRPVLAALAVGTLLVGGGLSLLASAYPDGLEWAMQKTAGTAELPATGPVFRAAQTLQNTTAFLPDYNLPGTGEDAAALGTSASGVLGAAMTALLAGGAGVLVRALKRRARQVPNQP
ncbi:MAG: energy-coupling factor ABC transporter permease [Oscillospiraceae bacterium]|jgi:cobalt/nickel transport system permease protein|nr:energy-coupling factor ABC transporter permease [Oscillospiraceae bacterium]